MSGRPSLHKKREESGTDDAAPGIQTRRMANRARSVAGDSHDEGADSSQDERDANPNEDASDLEEGDLSQPPAEPAQPEPMSGEETDENPERMLPYSQARLMPILNPVDAAPTGSQDAPPPARESDDAARPTPVPRKDLGRRGRVERHLDPVEHVNPESGAETLDEATELPERREEFLPPRAKRPTTLRVPRAARLAAARRMAETDTEYDTAVDENIAPERPSGRRKPSHHRKRNNSLGTEKFADRHGAMGDAGRTKSGYSTKGSDMESDAATDITEPVRGMEVIKSLVGLLGVNKRQRSEVDIAKFDGQNWEAFKTQFHQACEINDWSDNERATRLRCALTGKAQTFLHNAGCQTWSYEKMVKQMDKRFGSVAGDTGIAEGAVNLIMKPSEPVLHFGDRINAHLAKSSMSGETRNILAWLALMKGMRKHHRAMHSAVQRKVKNQDYQAALNHAEEWQRTNTTVDPEDDHEGEFDPNDGNKLLIAQLAEKMQAKSGGRTARSKLENSLAANGKQLEAMVRQLTASETSDSETSEETTELSDKFDAQEQKMEGIMAHIQQVFQRQFNNDNNVKLQPTKPIPKPGQGNMEARMEALTDKLLALQTAVEEREANRLAATQRRKEINDRKFKERRDRNRGGDNRDNRRDSSDRRDNRRNDRRGKNDYDDRRNYRSRDDSRDRSYNERQPAPAPPAIAPPTAAVRAAHA